MISPTYTIIAGSKACPNDCPICVSKMTPDYGIGLKKPEVNWSKFEDATKIALLHDAKNVLITSKGEPTLFPGQITEYLIQLYGKPFALRELQTEGSQLAKGGLYDDFLDVWKRLGLNTIALSIYHYDGQKNKELFRPKNGEHFDLAKLIDKFHSKDLNTRLSCVLVDGYIDNIKEVQNLIDFAKQNGVFQLTLRRADRPKKTLDQEVADFVEKHRLTEGQFRDISDFIEREGHFCYNLPHGAGVYEIDDQNVCVSTGLTPNEKNREVIRQLIFFPQGWLTTSWENVQGGRLL